jgi:hypothetical protein
MWPPLYWEWLRNPSSCYLYPLNPPFRLIFKFDIFNKEKNDFFLICGYDFQNCLCNVNLLIYISGFGWKDWGEKGGNFKTDRVNWNCTKIQGLFSQISLNIFTLLTFTENPLLFLHRINYNWIRIFHFPQVLSHTHKYFHLIRQNFKVSYSSGFLHI